MLPKAGEGPPISLGQRWMPPIALVDRSRSPQGPPVSLPRGHFWPVEHIWSECRAGWKYQGVHACRRKLPTVRQELVPKYALNRVILMCSTYFLEPLRAEPQLPTMVQMPHNTSIMGFPSFPASPLHFVVFPGTASQIYYLHPKTSLRV